MSTSFIKTQDFVLNYLNSFEKFDAATKEKWQDVFTAIFNCENSEEALTLITQAGANVVRPQNPNNLSYTALKKGAFVFWEGDGGQSLIGLVTKQPINESDKARVVVFTPNTMFSVSMTANELRNLQGIVDVNVPANVGVKGVVKMQELGRMKILNQVQGIFDQDGVYLGSDGTSNTYILKTTQATFFLDDNITIVPCQPISPQNADNTRNFIRANSGNRQAFLNQPNIYNNIVRIPNVAARREVLRIVSADDGGGDTNNDSNMREYGGLFTQYDTVVEHPAGAVNVVGAPEATMNIDMNLVPNIPLFTYVGMFHSHPSGALYNFNGLNQWYRFNKYPSVGDFTFLQNDPNIKLGLIFFMGKDKGSGVMNVAGLMRQQAVIIYTQAGIVAEMSLSAFNRISKF